MSRSRRVMGTITLIVAAYLIVIPFGLSLFSRTRDAQYLADRYRPVMSAQGLGPFRANLALVNAGGAELFNKFLPELQAKLKLSDADFNAFVATNYPHVAAFLGRVPVTVKYLNPATKAVLAQQDNFASADEFPATGIPVTVGPWALLLLGVALGVVGLLIFLSDRLGGSSLPIVAIFLVGLGLVVGPLVLGWFGKTDAAEHVAEAARPPFSVAVSDATVNDTFSFNAAFIEMRKAMFPAGRAEARHVGCGVRHLSAYQLPGVDEVPRQVGREHLQGCARLVAQSGPVHGRVPQCRRDAVPGIAVALHCTRRGAARRGRLRVRG